MSTHQHILGRFFHCPELHRLEVLEDALITFSGNGTIESVTLPENSFYAQALGQARDSQQLRTLGPHQIIIPGFVDLHIHAPQWPQLGKALHLPLEEWLTKYTFPLEARFHDLAYARCVYDSLVKTLLSHGTTTAMYFATKHVEATELLAELCLHHGQRAYVGKVAMDDPEQCPDDCRDANPQQAINGTVQLIRHIQTHPANTRGLVKPVITPRFIPSCTDELLQGLGELATEHRCHVQTHCSESDWEHQYVLDRLGKTDTEALADFGLLTRHSVLAHSNFMTDEDMMRVQHHGSGIAHCPLSNAYFANSVFPLRAALDKSVRVGLGTDISGGPSASMLDACRSAISSSRMLESGVDPQRPVAERGRPGSRINFIEAFHLATAGGADVLDAPVGLFEVGRQFDALLIDMDASGNPLDEFTEANSWEDVLGRIIYGAQKCNLGTVWVDGDVVTSPNPGARPIQE